MINHYFFPNIFPSSIYFPFNKFFTALFIIHPYTPLRYSFKYISNIFFYKFFYIPLFTLHPFLFFQIFKHNIFTNFTIPTWFQEQYISQIHIPNTNKFPNKKSPFRIFTPSFTYNTPSPPCHKPSITKKQKKKNKKKILLYKFSWRFLRRFTVINRCTIALNTDTTPIYIYSISHAQWKDQPYRYMQ